MPPAMSTLRDEGYRNGPPPTHVGVMWQHESQDEATAVLVETNGYLQEMAVHLGIPEERILAALWLLLRKRSRANAADDTSTMLMRLVAAGERNLFDAFPEDP